MQESRTERVDSWRTFQAGATKKKKTKKGSNGPRVGFLKPPGTKAEKRT